MEFPIKELFLLDPKVIFLNHGSFGACPRPVFAAYQTWQRKLECQPVQFFGRDYAAYDLQARQAGQLWLPIALWALFAIQFNVLFRWLRSRPVRAAVLGAIAGPLSFRAGSALGAVHFPDTTQAMTALAIGWAVLMPLMVYLASHWDGMSLSASTD